MTLMTVLFAFVMAACAAVPQNTVRGTASAQDGDRLTYVGACSWGPKTFGMPGRCEHTEGNALASFYMDTATKKLYVVNEITPNSFNYCRDLGQPATVPKLETSFGPAHIAWQEPGDQIESNVSVNLSKLNEDQASTQSQNYKQYTQGKMEMSIYAPCFFIRNPNAF